jgi:hypothetical protein
MGFEVVYSYHDRLDDGGYDKENTKNMKKKVGKAEEEIPYDKLAGTIMAQLARRDIWVVDVEVFEFSKKKVSFKECKGGLVIGNKKYSLDACGSLGIQEVADVPPPQPVPHVQTTQQELAAFKPALQGTQIQVSEEMLRGAPNVNVADLQLLKKRPLRYEVYHPNTDLVDMQKARSFAFTVGEKYPIYAEKAAGNDNRLGMNYTTIDNNGRKQVLNDKHFVPSGSLIGGDQFNEKRDMDLFYGDDGGFGNQMPQLR